MGILLLSHGCFIEVPVRTEACGVAQGQRDCLPQKMHRKRQTTTVKTWCPACEGGIGAAAKGGCRERKALKDVPIIAISVVSCWIYIHIIKEDAKENKARKLPFGGKNDY